MSRPCKTEWTVHTFVRQHMKLASDRMKQYYDIDTQESKLEVGDPVWLYYPQQKKGLSPKLQKPWQGPYVIIKRISDLIYRIQLGPQSRPRVVHFNRLWKYHGENPPRWLITTESNPAECMEPTDNVQSDEGALDIPSTENGATTTSNTTICGVIAPAPSDGVSVPRRSSCLRRRPEQYGDGTWDR